MRTCIGLRLAVVVLVFAPAGVRAQAPTTKQPPKAEPPSAALKTLQVHPPQIAIDGPRAEQRIGVLGDYADGRRWDLSHDAKITSSAESVVVVDKDGII